MRNESDQTSTNGFETNKKSSGEIYWDANITTTIATKDESSSSISETAINTSSQNWYSDTWYFIISTLSS